MPVRTLERLSADAIDHGLDPSTPEAAVVRATRHGEQIIATTIAELPARLAAESTNGPVIVLIGQVLKAHVADEMSRFRSIQAANAANR
jgi:uroporphyrin-III C-methyltransferase / precorrin-2 dehydrogenase / sirohydrochlorin ferrochelatase